MSLLYSVTLSESELIFLSATALREPIVTQPNYQADPGAYRRFQDSAAATRLEEWHRALDVIGSRFIRTSRSLQRKGFLLVKDKPNGQRMFTVTAKGERVLEDAKEEAERLAAALRLALEGLEARKEEAA